MALIAVAITAGVSGALPKESVRDELIRRQGQTGLTLAGYYGADLAVVLFANRVFPNSGEGIFSPSDFTHSSKYMPEAVISPDGLEVAFQTTDPVRGFATSGLEGSSRHDYPGMSMPSQMCWSYDRSQILLATREHIDRDHTILQILDVATKTTRDTDAGAFIYLSSQCWSPDEKRVAYETQDPIRRKKDGSGEMVNPTVKVYDLNLGKSQELAKGSSPSWSPDGKRIAFLDHDTYFAIAPDGSSRASLFHKGNAHSGLTWSPDSRLVAYLSGNGLFEPPILLDVGPVRLRVRRLSDNSEDWVVQLTDAYLPTFQWLENKDLVSRAESKNSSK